MEPVWPDRPCVTWVDSASGWMSWICWASKWGPFGVSSPDPDSMYSTTVSLSFLMVCVLLLFLDACCYLNWVVTHLKTIWVLLLVGSDFNLNIDSLSISGWNSIMRQTSWLSDFIRLLICGIFEAGHLETKSNTNNSILGILLEPPLVCSCSMNNISVWFYFIYLI